MVRFTCACGVSELVSGSSKGFRCSTCRPKHRPATSHNWTGKEEAGMAVQRAIALGQLPHPRGLACVDCGGVAIEYEHRDYGKPLAVEPICRGCNLRRGPAIPVAGTIRRLSDAGLTPYRRRLSAERILERMGRNPREIVHLPLRLTNEHWRAIAPLFDPTPEPEARAA